MTEQLRDVEDPRAEDFPEDSALWTSLLRVAYVEDGDDPNGSYSVLLGIRACGAKLYERGGKLRIDPRYDRNVEKYLKNPDRYIERCWKGLEEPLVSLWDDDSRYRVDRSLLVPHSDKITGMLTALQKAREESDAGPAETD